MDPMTSSKDVIQKQRELLFPCVANYYEDPVVITKAQGTTVTDIEGRDYLDFFGGILTVSLGHCEPHVVESVQRQVGRLGHTSTLYPTENMLKVADRMARLTPGALKKSFFTNSGTEADETAVVLAKIYTGQHEIIALRHGYHGRSHLAMALTAHARYHVIPSMVPGIRHARAPYCYRCPYDATYPTCGLKCAQDIEELILTETTGKPAAFLAEPIMGVGGFITPPKGYFEVAVGIVRKHGGLFICDEVQTGFGRTGGKWFGIEHWGVEPDIMTFAKGMANGMPIGATIAKPEIADAWKGATISTFGGNPVSMAAADATLDVMERENIPARSETMGKMLRDHLEAMKEKFPFIGDVRGMGLMQAIELVEDRKTKEPAVAKTAQVMEAAKKQGLLLGRGSLHNNTLRIAPPMLLSKSEMEEGCKKLEAALETIK